MFTRRSFGSSPKQAVVPVIVLNCIWGLGAGKTAETEGKADGTQTCVQIYEVQCFLEVEQQVTPSSPFTAFVLCWCHPRLRKMLMPVEPPPVSALCFCPCNPFITTRVLNQKWFLIQTCNLTWILFLSLLISLITNSGGLGPSFKSIRLGLGFACKAHLTDQSVQILPPLGCLWHESAWELSVETSRNVAEGSHALAFLFLPPSSVYKNYI